VTLERILTADAHWSETIRRAERPGIVQLVATVLAHSGDSWFWGLGLAFVAWRGDAFWRSWAVHILICIGVLAVLVLTIKLLVRRRRPPGEWGAIYRSTDPHSFPSGHAARAVLLAILLTAWGPAWAAPLAILWAPLVALARVALGVHYLSDILAGGLLGLAAALVVITVSSP
jgi:membrane-associated phospholipid phosphatase